MLTCQHFKSILTTALMFFRFPDGSFRHGKPCHLPPEGRLKAEGATQIENGKL